MRANVASVICGNASTVDDDSQDDEASASADLDETDDEFDLAISLHSEELDDDKQKKQGNDPSSVVNVFCSLPVMNLQPSQHENTMKRVCLPLTMLQAAEISNGSTVSQLMAYSQAMANPRDGSTKRQMYMVKAPLTGYMTDNSARACIMR